MQDIIKSVKKYVPVYWPLQSFISTNPLHGLTNQPMDECLHHLSRYLPVNGSLKALNYHEFYAQGKISVCNLRCALEEFIHDKKIPGYNLPALTALFINKKFQHQIERIFNVRQEMACLLISKQSEEFNIIRQNMIRFFADFFDQGMAKWAMPVSSNNLYHAWREYAGIENRYIAAVINEVSSVSVEAISYILPKLEVPKDMYEKYLAEIVFQLIGWCSFIHWLELRPENPYIKKSAAISDLLAIWLCHEYALTRRYNILFKPMPDILDNKIPLIEDIFKVGLVEDTSAFNMYSISLIWQRAFELSYQEEILAKIVTNKPVNITTEVVAQAVFCIDTRSEGLRRKLESLGNYATYGFAGFFGIGFGLHDEYTHENSLQLPALSIPDKTLNNKPTRKKLWKEILHLVENVFHNAKNAYLSPFILFDSAGSWYAFSIFGRTIIPQKFNSWLKLSEKPHYKYNSINVFESGYSIDSLAAQVSAVLTTIGLTSGFARLVFICGHYAQSENNPFQSSMNCGACGGNSGTPNAIAFCQVLNDVRVREKLRLLHLINIPDTTHFISASHNTTSDEILYYNMGLHEDTNLFRRIRHDFHEASLLLKKERKHDLNGNDSVETRMSNWAELVPELSLANNAAFIIAPRSLTHTLNLERRVFLQSYVPENDTNGEILANILSTVVMVGYFINCQYYFSSTDPSIFGSGNKTLHNVVGHFGVMEGNYSDFKIGLSRQSIMDKNELIFYPLRMLVVINARQELVDSVLERLPEVAKLFNGRWMHLKVIEPA